MYARVCLCYEGVNGTHAQQRLMVWAHALHAHTARTNAVVVVSSKARTRVKFIIVYFYIFFFGCVLSSRSGMRVNAFVQK